MSKTNKKHEENSSDNTEQKGEGDSSPVSSTQRLEADSTPGTKPVVNKPDSLQLPVPTPLDANAVTAANALLTDELTDELSLGLAAGGTLISATPSSLPIEGTAASAETSMPSASRSRGRPRGSRNTANISNGLGPRAIPPSHSPASNNRQLSPAIQLEMDRLRKENEALKNAPKPEEIFAAFSGGIAQLSKTGFSIVSRYRGVHWKITEDEANEMGSAIATAIQPYMNVIAPAVPWLVVVGAVGGVVLPRLDMDEKIESGEMSKVLSSGKGE